MQNKDNTHLLDPGNELIFRVATRTGSYPQGQARRRLVTRPEIMFHPRRYCWLVCRKQHKQCERRLFGTILHYSTSGNIVYFAFAVNMKTTVIHIE